ncbi:gas vesicle protein [Streptomyces sp. LP05-1]|uniref:Gas vesicle protein n=1 Tax=Streptomyces pyxinae TaxID=2970734 RepID=A0ABT2CM74_9ACTN|nr:gas vesicle protein [Streptomyces sp. LP05-1]MCS0638547.1 gas vesicle protein [Streptomyces sp. LP05-1]
MTTGSDLTEPLHQRRIALVDLLDRLLAGGVVITGDLTLRIAEVDLVRIDLKALISSVNASVPSPFVEPGGSQEPWEAAGLQELRDKADRIAPPGP